MSKFYPMLAMCLFAIFCNGQEKSRLTDFTVAHYTNKLELAFDNAVQSVQAFDAFTGAPLAVESSGNMSRITTSPAEQVRLEYVVNNIPQTTYLAAKSLSTGEIKVYFNHQVDTSVAFPGNNAVNLGNTVDNKLIELIDACASTLDIAIYNSSSPSSATGLAGAINAAYERGVQVRVIYDGSTTSSMIDDLNPAIPKISSPQSSSYGIMHNKFVIFDAASADPNKPLVWTGSTNWTVTQIDGPDKNNVITLQDQSLALGYTIEFQEMWGSSTATPNLANSKFGPFKTDNTPHSYIIGGKAVQSYFSPSDGVTSKIVNAINSANSDIDVCTMLITRDQIANAIINNYNNGLTNVNLVVDTQNPVGNDFPAIQSVVATNHAVVYSGAGILHHKFLVVDNFNSDSDPLVLTGSHNWSSAAENNNDENTIVVHDANIANQYYQAFYYLYLQAGGALGVTHPTASSFTLYPNPTDGFVYLNQGNNANGEVEISLYDCLGKAIYNKTTTLPDTAGIDLSAQPSGIYLMKVRSGNNVEGFKVVRR